MVTVKKSIILIIIYIYDITHKSKNHVSHNYIYIYMYYVRFISICNGIIGEDAVGLPVLFTDCVKVIGSGGVLSYLGGD